MAIKITVMRSRKYNAEDAIGSEIAARTANQFSLNKELELYPIESIVYHSILGEETDAKKAAKKVWYIISDIQFFVNIDSNNKSARKALAEEIQKRLTDLEINEYRATPVVKDGDPDDMDIVPTNVPDQEGQPPDPNDPGPPDYEQ